MSPATESGSSRASSPARNPGASLATPKSRILAWPLLRDEDVGGLDVAMNDALGMARGQRVGHLDADVEDLFQIHRLAAHAVLQAHALQLLHHDEGMAVDVFDVVDGADAGMVQLRGGARFPEKAVQRLAVVHHLVGNKLQGDVTAKARVDRRRTPRPCHRHRAFPRSGSGRRSGQSCWRTRRPLAVMVGRSMKRVNPNQKGPVY